MIQQLDSLLREVVREQKGLADVVFSIRQFNELVSRINSLSKDCWEREKMIRSLETEMALKNVALDGFEEENRALDQAIQQFKYLMVENLQEFRNGLDQDTQKQQGWKSLLERERETIQFLETSLKDATEEKSQAKTELAIVASMRDRLESEKAIALGNFQRVQGLADTLAKRGEEARREIDSLRSTEHKWKEAREEHQSQIRIKNQEITQLLGMVKEKDAAIESLNSLRDKDKTLILELRRDIESKQRLKSKEAEEKKRLDHTLQENTALQKELASVKAQLAELEDSTSHLKTENKSLLERVHQLEKEVGEASKKRENSKSPKSKKPKEDDAPNADQAVADFILVSGSETKEAQNYIKKLFNFKKKTIFKTSKSYMDLLVLAESEQKEQLFKERQKQKEVESVSRTEKQKSKKMDEEERKRPKSGKNTTKGESKDQIEIEPEIVSQSDISLVSVDTKGRPKPKKTRGKRKVAQPRKQKKMDEEKASVHGSREEADKSRGSSLSAHSFKPISDKINSNSPVAQKKARDKLLSMGSELKFPLKCSHDTIMPGCDECESWDAFKKMTNQKRG